ncbi:hypothetical protein HMPREF9130_0576 [Peptoniphilus sp. oral taxon 375 str. F0436]|nr:hypothetical protein HMPREF9130_0576 [Peptoniphilus sp. oral taxon 375 str. F0436]
MTNKNKIEKILFVLNAQAGTGRTEKIKKKFKNHVSSITYMIFI